MVSNSLQVIISQRAHFVKFFKKSLENARQWVYNIVIVNRVGIPA